jgi:nucleoside-diphosphate-sugar epimerase
MARIAIVGAGGFIGRPLAAQLKAAGHEMVAIGRANADHVETVDAVVHLLLFNEADALAAREKWRNRAGRLVVISSGDVYRVYGQVAGLEPWDGTQPPPLVENAPLRQKLYPYGREVPSPLGGTLVDYEKILVERALEGATILRLPKVYGPGDRQRTFAREIAAGEARLDAATANWRWTHGYVDDVAAAIALAATHPRAAGRLYNVGERETPTQATRLQALGVRVVIEAIGSPRPDLVYDTHRIRDELGFAEITSDPSARTVSAYGISIPAGGQPGGANSRS